MRTRLGSRLGLLYADTLARASGYILVTYLVTALLGFGYWVLAARLYTPADVGTAAVSISTMGLASLLSIFGMTAAPVQRLPSRRHGREWNLTVTVAMCFAASSGSAAGLVSWLVVGVFVHAPQLHSLAYGLVIAGSTAVTNVGMVLESIWIVERSAETRLLTSTTTSLVKIALLVLPPMRGLDALGIQTGWGMALLVGTVLSIGLFRWRREFSFATQGFFPELANMRRNMVGNYVVSLGANSPTYMAPLVVGALVSAGNMAYFYAAWRIGSLFFLGSAAIASALFAEGSRAPASSIRKAQRAMLVVVPSLFCGSLLLLLIGPTVLSAFGGKYREHALGLLFFLILAAVPDALTAVYRTVLRIRRRYSRAAWFMWGMAAIQIGLTAALLPLLGITGAGAAWLLAELAGAAVYGLDSWRSRRPGAVPEPSRDSAAPFGTELEDMAQINEGLR